MSVAEYFLAPSLVTFRNSINQQFPKRDKSSDGWIGDASHAARASEHNPCWTCTGYQHGIVRATDTDIDDNDAGRDLRKEILNSAIGHPAVWYVISNGIIYSRTYGWKARKYTGPNAHTKHVHISINKNEKSAKDLTLKLKPLAKPAPVQTSPSPRDVTISAVTLNNAAKGARLGIGTEQANDCFQFMAWAAHKNIGVITTGQRDAYRTYVGTKKDFAYAGRMMKVTIQKVQAKFNLKPDGIVGPKTARVLRAYGYKITGTG